MSTKPLFVASRTPFPIQDFLAANLFATINKAASPREATPVALSSCLLQPCLAMHSVLIVIGDAAETVDTLYPFYRIQEEGWKPVVIAPEARRYNMVLHEVQPGWTITREFEGYTLVADQAFKDVKPEEHLGIFLAAGARRNTSVTMRI
jgi:hypothetical protein